MGKPPLIPDNVKLKDLPVLSRILLRLVTLSEKQQNTASVMALSKEVGCKFIEARTAVEKLASEKLIEFTPIDAGNFKFGLPNLVRGWFKLAASNYQRHLKAKTASPPKLPPAHLTPITSEQRAPYLEKATIIAEQLGAVNLTKKVANCITRLGEAEVDKILAAVMEANKADLPDKPSKVRNFFTTYTQVRNERFPAQ